jgi:putative FmdB family regulatory protein
MPIFRYVCIKCEHGWDELVRRPDEEPEKCPNPECESPEIERDIKGLAPSHVYKGRGFYTTDYKRRGK